MDRAPTVKVPMENVKEGDTVTISLTYLLAHASSPLPKEISQSDPQYLVWTANSTYVDTWYFSDVERIKIRQVIAQCFGGLGRN